MDKTLEVLNEQNTFLQKQNEHLRQQLAAVRQENDDLNAELDAMIAEPQWFSHRGDWCVVVAIMGILVAAGYLAGTVKGWW